MPSATNPNAPHHHAMASEFAKHIGYAGLPRFEVVFVSPVEPEARQVLKVTLGDEAYALKVDFTSAETGRLEGEFNDLKALHRHFSGYDKLGTATPLYLSPTKRFFAMEYLDHYTAGRRLRRSDSAQATKQVYRRVGLWLTAMHEFKPQKRSPFYGRWMPQEVDQWIAQGQMVADEAAVARMNAQLAEQIEEVQLVKDTRVWSHGDFHSENIMLGPGMTYAYDLTEAKMKLALYDIVDFLKVDVYRDTPAAEVDSSGITAAHREMFFRGYKHKVKPKLFEVAMRGRLLIDWASITPQSHAANEEDRVRFAQLRKRLEIAFRD